MSGFSAAIDLAHEDPFMLGDLTVRPSTREVARGDGTAEVLEPRVMQVLVALYRARGAVVSRDDLTQSCWDGRVVGEDAINRVISRLRRTAEGIGERGFRVETVTKVGYRLAGDFSASAMTAVEEGAAAFPPIRSDAAHRRPDRRVFVAGGVTATALALAGAGWWVSRRRDAPSAEVAALVSQARTAITQLDRQSETQAVGLLRRVVELQPDYADGWGQLAYAYVMVGQFSPSDKKADARARARAAAARARQLDPDNPFARLAMTLDAPVIGNWLALDHVTRDGLARHPDDELMLLYLGGVYAWTGQLAKAAELAARVSGRYPPAPGPMTSLVIELWGSDQLEDADRAMDETYRLFPLDAWVWSTRFELLTYSGRADQALTMVRDADARPASVDERDARRLAAIAQAMLTRAPADIAAASAQTLAAARAGAASCWQAIGFASSVGRLDDAFPLITSLFFDTPYVVGGPGPTVTVGRMRVRADRNTLYLFIPPMAAMRRDPRFAALTRAIGLDRYWRQSGTRPDFRRTG